MTCNRMHCVAVGARHFVAVAILSATAVAAELPTYNARSLVV
jgi:hypothetical protein